MACGRCNLCQIILFHADNGGKQSLECPSISLLLQSQLSEIAAGRSDLPWRGQQEPASSGTYRILPAQTTAVLVILIPTLWCVAGGQADALRRRDARQRLRLL
eukprot:COSAG04_NODE_12220_length_664_cov_1.008850_1_plen_102_part_10